MVLTFFNIVSAMRSEILKVRCSHILQIVDTARPSLVEIPSDSDYTKSTLILPLLSNSNANYVHRRSYVPSLRFSQICSLILHDITDLVLQLESETPLEVQHSITEWPEHFFPGYPHSDYHVFIYNTENPVASVEQIMLARLARKIHKAFFIFLSHNFVDILRTSSDGQYLQLLSELNPTTTALETRNLLRLGENKPNYDGGVLLATTCPMCGQPFLEIFQATGKWLNPYDAVVYFVSLAVNATVQFQGAAAVPQMEPDADGDWDPWVAPLIDESAAVATFQPYSVARLHAFHYPGSFVHDYVNFITAQPRRLKATRNTLIRFMSPLTKEVWFWIAASLGTLFITIELAIHFHRCKILLESVRLGYRKDSLFQLPLLPSKNLVWKHFHYQTFTELMRPLFNQGGSAEAFEMSIRNDVQAKCLLSLWFLAMIVLGSGYQSAMKSRIVAPEYTKPPRTFRELANSHFKPYAIYWTGQIEEGFKDMGTDFSQKLVESVTEFGYIDPDVSYRLLHLEGYMNLIKI